MRQKQQNIYIYTHTQIQEKSNYLHFEIRVYHIRVNNKCEKTAPQNTMKCRLFQMLLLSDHFLTELLVICQDFVGDSKGLLSYMEVNL
jgi:hypothetical protein